MIKEYTNYSLLPYNTFGMNVQAAHFVEYDSADELSSFLQKSRHLLLPYLHIGGGSNLLFTTDYPGTILHSAIKGFNIIKEGDNWIEVRAGAGEIWDDFVTYAIENNWYGTENLSLIPGEVGASAVQNIGAYGVEVKDLITEVETIEISTGNKRVFTNAECNYAYRSSIFKQELKGKYIVTHVTYRLSKKPTFKLDYGNIRTELEKEGCSLTLASLRNIIVRIREAKLPDPKVLGNAGSFFMNPIISLQQFNELTRKYPDMPHYVVDDMHVKVPAGWLIDRCGWKGKSFGGAAVYEKQCLVLINKNNAKPNDVVALAEMIRKSVSDTYGIVINPEVNYIE